MKKILLIALIILGLSAPAYSDYVSARTKEFTLMAGYAEVLYLEIDEIPAQSNQYIAGMPFNIEDYQVQANETEHGREIATWNLLTNTSEFDLKIWGTPMTYVGEQENKTDLHYYLNIQYVLGYYLPGGSISSSESTWHEGIDPAAFTEANPKVIDMLKGIDGIEVPERVPLFLQKFDYVCESLTVFGFCLFEIIDESLADFPVIYYSVPINCPVES